MSRLTLGDVADHHEHEADDAAARLTGEAPPIPRSRTRADAGLPAPRQVEQVLASPGIPLDDGLRADWGARLGADFSGVRLHTDAAGAASAAAIGAAAYAFDRHIVFGAGRFAPHTSHGRRLLVHELAHVAQRSAGAPPAVRRSAVEVEEGEGRGEGGRGPLSGEAPPSAGAGGGAGGGSGAAGGAGVPELCRPPETMRCPESVITPSHELELLFDVASAVIRPDDLRMLDAMAVLWGLMPSGFVVRIDGFASTEGPCEFNWVLSCQRAEAVRNRLLAPVGGPGIAAADLPHFAHGESDAAGPTLTANRRATLDLQFHVAPPAQPAPAPAPDTPDDCSPSGARQTATGCTPNPLGAHLPDVGATHTEAHALQPCSLTQAQVAASPDWCVDRQQAHGGEVCYREIPATNGGPGDQFCYSENCCHNSRDAVSVVSSTSPGSNACCETNTWAVPEHVWEDVVPEFIDDPERVLRDILGL